MRTAAVRCGVWALGVLATMSLPLRAQTFTGNPVVDSASVARAAWASALQASRAGEPRRARDAVGRAVSAWPTQPVYLWARAILAAGLGDTASVEHALRAYAALGLGRPLADTAFDRYRTLPWFAAVASEHERHRATVARSRVAATLSDSTLWPEGIDVDRRSGNMYVTSVRHGTIVEVSPAGRERLVWPADGRALGAVLALRVDPRGDRIWATLSPIPQWAGYAPGDSSAALLELRIADGHVLRARGLPRGKHVLGDLAVAANGDVYLSDSAEPVLYRLPAGAHALESFRDPLFRSLQGIAPSPRANEVYVADYSHGILHVDLKRLVVTRVADAPGSTTLGVDGLTWSDDALIAIQNGVEPARVMRFELDRTGKRFSAAYVLDRRVEADEPTIGALVGKELFYVANSLWAKSASDGQLRAGGLLARPLILAVPVARPD